MEVFLELMGEFDAAEGWYGMGCALVRLDSSASAQNDSVEVCGRPGGFVA